MHGEFVHVGSGIQELLLLDYGNLNLKLNLKGVVHHSFRGLRTWIITFRSLIMTKIIISIVATFIEDLI